MPSNANKCLKSSYPDPETTRGYGSKVNHFYRVTRCPCLPSLVDVRFRVCQLSCLQNDRQNDHITSASLTDVIKQTVCDTMIACYFMCNFTLLFPLLVVYPEMTSKTGQMSADASVRPSVRPCGGNIFKGSETAGPTSMKLIMCILWVTFNRVSRVHQRYR